jgi:hypothetical protein
MTFWGLVQWFSKWAHQVSKGPLENDGKLEGRSNFWVGHRNSAAWIEYIKFKIDSKVPCNPRSTEGPVYFVAFPTSYLVETGFSWMTYLLPKVHKCYDVKRDDLRLSLPTQQPNIKKKTCKCSASLRNTMDRMPIIDISFTCISKQCFIHSFSILSDNRSNATSKTVPPHSAI